MPPSTDILTTTTVRAFLAACGLACTLPEDLCGLPVTVTDPHDLPRGVAHQATAQHYPITERLQGTFFVRVLDLSNVEPG